MFQAGILNYAKFYSKLCAEPFVSVTGPGLMTLVSERTDLDESSIIDSLGKNPGKEAIRLAKQVQAKIDKASDPEFAIPMEWKVVFAKKSEDADATIVVGPGSNSQIAVVEKTVSEFKDFKYKRGQAVARINERLIEAIGIDGMKKKGVIASNGRIKFTTGHFDKIATKEKWRSGNNEFHRHWPDDYGLRKFSTKALDFIVEGVLHTTGFIDSYRR